MNGKKFKKLRLKLGLKQEDVAKYLGISRVAVAKWETEVAAPRSELLPKIAKLLKCKIDDVF